jgi:hypothetical protein
MEAVTLMRTFGFQRSKSSARGKRDMFLRNRYTCEHFFTLDGVKKEGFGFPLASPLFSHQDAPQAEGLVRGDA